MKFNRFLRKASPETLQRLYFYLSPSTLQQVLKVDYLRLNWIDHLNINSLELEIGDLVSVTTEPEFYGKLERLTIRSALRVLACNPFDNLLGLILSQTVHLKALDVSFNRSITDDHMAVVLRQCQIEHLTFASCPLITNRTLESIERTRQERLTVIAFTIPEIKFRTLFKIIDRNPNAIFLIPTYLYAGKTLEMYYGSDKRKIQHPYTTYSALHAMTKENRLFDDWPAIPFIMQASVGNEEHGWLDTDGPEKWASKACNSVGFITMLILERKIEIFEKVLVQMGKTQLLNFFLHALELGGKEVFEYLPSFIEAVLKHSEKVASENNLPRFYVFYSLLDLNKVCHIQKSLFFDGASANEILKMDLAHLCLYFKNARHMFARYNIGIWESSRYISVFAYFYKRGEVNTCREILGGCKVDCELLCYCLSHMDVEVSPAVLNLTQLIVQNKDFDASYVNENGENLLHLLMRFPSIVVPSNSAFLQNFWRTLIARKIDVKQKNNIGLIPFDIGLLENNLPAVKSLVSVLDASTYTVNPMVLRTLSERNRVEVLNYVLRRKIIYKAADIGPISFPRLHLGDEVDAMSALFVLFDYPHVFGECVKPPQLQEATIKIRRGKLVFQYRPFEFALLYGYPDPLISNLLKIQEFEKLASFRDSALLTNHPNFSKFIKDGETIIEADPVFLLIESPHFELFVQKSRTIDINSKIVIERAGNKTTFNLLEYSMQYRLPLPTIYRIISKTSNLSVNFDIFDTWLEIYFNFFLKPIAGIRTFADIDFPLMNYVHCPPDRVEKKLADDASYFARILCSLDRKTMFYRNMSHCPNETPILFNLLQFSLLYSGVTSIIEDSIKDESLIMPCDKLGNTIMHLLARYSNDLFLTALKNKKIDLNFLNMQKETCILSYVKMVNTNNERLEEAFESISSHPALSHGGRTNYDTLFSFDISMRNLYTVVILRDLLSNDKDSLLTENVMLLTRDLASDHTDQFIHGFFQFWPYVIVTDHECQDDRTHLEYKKWDKLFQRVVELKLPLNAPYEEKTILDYVLLNEYGATDIEIEFMTGLMKRHGCLRFVDITPEVFINPDRNFTKLHEACVKGMSFQGVLKSFPDLIKSKDMNGRLPLHLYCVLETSRGPNCLEKLKSLWGNSAETATILCGTLDDWIMIPVMCSLLGDVYNGIDIEQQGPSFMSKYLIDNFFPATYPENDSQQTAPFLLPKHLAGIQKNSFDYMRGDYHLTPAAIGATIKAWQKYCKIELNDIDENGKTIRDVWEQDYLPQMGILDSSALENVLSSLQIASTVDEDMSDPDAPKVTYNLQAGINENVSSILTPVITKKELDTKEHGIRGMLEVAKDKIKNTIKAELVDLESQSTKRAHPDPTPSNAKKPRTDIQIVGSASAAGYQAEGMEYEEEELDQGDILSIQPFVDLTGLDKIEDLDKPSGMVMQPNDSPNDRPKFIKTDSLFKHEGAPAAEEYEHELSQPTTALFVAAASGNNASVTALSMSGADPLARNSNSQYPLHVWCASVSNKVDFKEISIRAFDTLLPRGTADLILNHYDHAGDTPFSIMLTHDVWVWSIKNGFFNPAREPRVQPLERIFVPMSKITASIKKSGATLRKPAPGGLTAWHVLAGRLYSNNQNQKVIGFNPNSPMFILQAALILKKYRDDGGLNLNLLDQFGRTGLDILVERFRNYDMNISDADFDVLINHLESLGCQRTQSE